MQGRSTNFHHRPLPASRSYQEIYAEIEEIGWEQLLRLEEDLSTVSFRVRDKKERVHAVEIKLPQNYPNSAPSLAADVPYACELHWRKGLHLKDAIQQFVKVLSIMIFVHTWPKIMHLLLYFYGQHLEKVQEFWSVLEEVDRSLCVLEPKQESRAASFRLICAGDGCQILLNIDAKNPRSKPECRFLGPNLQTETLWKSWKKNSRKWANDKPFIENLRTLLGVDLPGPLCPPTKGSEQDECGICYVHFLPSEITKEDGEPEAPTGGMAVDYKCENPSCRKSFHTICLRDWLKSITTTKQSFNVLFGKCPYCSEPVAVQLEGSR